MLGVAYVKPLIVATLFLLTATVGTFMWGQANKRLAKQYGVQFELVNTQLIQERESKERMRAQLLHNQKKYSEAGKDLDNALKQEAEWADTPIPAAIREQLCNTGNCNSL